MEHIREHMMQTWIRIYWGPVLAILAFLATAFWMTGKAYLQAIREMLHDPAWWADATFTVIVFTVLISWITGLAQRYRTRIEREPFEGWQLEFGGLAAPPEPQGLYWEDVRKNLTSDFELWKFAKSTVSSSLWISTPSLQEAKERWLLVEKENRRIVIDFAGMTSQDVEDMKKLEALLKGRDKGPGRREKMQETGNLAQNDRQKIDIQQ